MGRSFKEMDFTILERGAQIKSDYCPAGTPRDAARPSSVHWAWRQFRVFQASSGMNLPFPYSAPNPGNKGKISGG